MNQPDIFSECFRDKTGDQWERHTFCPVSFINHFFPSFLVASKRFYHLCSNLLFVIAKMMKCLYLSEDGKCISSKPWTDVEVKTLVMSNFTPSRIFEDICHLWFCQTRYNFLRMWWCMKTTKGMTFTFPSIDYQCLPLQQFTLREDKRHFYDDHDDKVSSIWKECIWRYQSHLRGKEVLVTENEMMEWSLKGRQTRQIFIYSNKNNGSDKE